MKKLISSILVLIMALTCTSTVFADDFEYKSPTVDKEKKQYVLYEDYTFSNDGKQQVILKDDCFQVYPSKPSDSSLKYTFLSWTITTKDGNKVILDSTVTKEGAVTSENNVGTGTYLTATSASGSNIANLILYKADGVTIATYGVDFTYSGGVVTSLKGEPLVIQLSPLEDEITVADSFLIGEKIVTHEYKDGTTNTTVKTDSSKTSPKTGYTSVVYMLIALIAISGVALIIVNKKKNY